jgi:hypothetical protein
MMAGNFLRGMTLKTRLQLRDELMAALDQIGATAAQKRDAEGEWRKDIGLTYNRAIGARLRAGGDKGECVHEKLKALMTMDEWRAPTPKQIKAAFSACGYEPSEEVAALFEDYQYYLDHNEIRHRELLEAAREPRPGRRGFIHFREIPISG